MPDSRDVFISYARKEGVISGARSLGLAAGDPPYLPTDSLPEHGYMVVTIRPGDALQRHWIPMRARPYLSRGVRTLFIAVTGGVPTFSSPPNKKYPSPTPTSDSDRVRVDSSSTILRVPRFGGLHCGPHA